MKIYEHHLLFALIDMLVRVVMKIFSLLSDAWFNKNRKSTVEEFKRVIMSNVISDSRKERWFKFEAKREKM